MIPSPDCAAPPLVAERFILGPRLGAGTGGTIWRATDRRTGAHVALKLIDDAEASLAEFERAARLSHPHIARTLGCGRDGQGGIYLVVELLDAVPFDEACRNQDVPGVLRLAEQALSALKYLHHRGVVHADIKPSNVLVTRGGTVKVIDFGLSEIGGCRSSGGTPAFMAPEVLTGGGRDERSDLYALGVMLYSVLAGGNPFEAPTVAETLDRQVSLEPPALTTAGVPVAVSNVVERLTAKGVARRYRTASEALDALTTVLGADDGAVSRPLRLGEPALVGRERLIEQCMDAVADAGRGQGRCIAVVGPSGIGKSRLLEEVGIRAQLSGVPVVRVAGDADLRLSGISGPTLLVVEDCQARQWTPATADALLGLARTFPVALLLVGPAPAFTGEGALARAFGGERARERASELTVPALSWFETSRVLEGALAEPIDADSVVTPIHELSEGNPMLALELLGALVARRRVIRREGRVRPAEPGRLFEAGDGDDALQVVLASHLAALSPRARGVLEAVAVLESSTSVLLAQVAELDTLCAARDVAALIDRGLCIKRNGRYELARPALAPVIRARLDDERRRALHARAYRALASRGAPPARLVTHALGSGNAEAAWAHGPACAAEAASRGELKRAAELWQGLSALADTPEQVRAAAIAEAPLCMTLGRYERAQALLSTAGDPPDLAPMRARLAVRLGHADQAASLAEALLTSDQSTSSALTAAEVLRIVGRPADARRALELALTRLGRADASEQRADILTELATIDWQLGRKEAALARAQAALTAAQACNDPERVAAARMALGTAHRVAGRHQEAIEHYQGAEAHFQQVGALAKAVKCNNNIAVCHYLLGERREACQRWEIALEAVDRTSEVAEETHLRNNLGFLYMERGVFDRARESLERAHRMALALADRRMQAIVLGNLGDVHLRQGDPVAARRCLERGLVLAREVGSEGDAAETRRRLVSVAIDEARFYDAIMAAEELLERARADKSDDEIPILLRLLGQAEMGLGDLEDAAVVILEARALLGDDDDSLESGELWRAQAELAHRREDTHRAVEAIDRARSIFEALDAAWHLETCRTLAADIHRAHRLRRPPEASLAAAGLPRLLSALARGTGPEEVCRTALDAVLSMTGAERGLIYTTSTPEREELRVHAHSSTETWEGEADAFSQTVARRVLQQGRTVCLQNVDEDASIASAQSVMAMRLRSLLCVPIPLGEQVAGLVYLDSRCHTGQRFADAVEAVEGAAAALGLALSRLYQASRMRSQAEMLSAVAHELRNPIGALIGHAQLVQMDHTDAMHPEVGEFVDLAERVGHRMARLVSDVGQLGHVLSIPVSARTPIDVTNLLAELDRTMVVRKSDARVALRFDVARDLPSIEGDRQRIIQVLVNLVTNAIRHSPPGGVVTVQVQRHEIMAALGEQPCLRFSIRDQGDGVALADREKIFRKFDRGSRPVGEGTGLGLSIVRSVVQAHGGRVWLGTPKPGEGAIFELTLPIHGE